MKKIMFLVFIMVVFLIGACNKEEAQRELKLAHSYETTTAFHKGAVWAADEIKKQTEGRYVIEVFPSELLGNAREMEEGLILGSIDLAFIGPGHMAQTYAPISVHLAAFLWRDIEHFLLYPKSNTYKKVTSEYMKKSNNHILALTYFGQRHVTSNVALNTPEDFKGLKMRVPPLPVYMVFPNAVDANSTPINFSELYLALQQGVVSAQENPLPTIKAKKFYEVQDYIILTGHMTDGFYTLAGDSLWSDLSEEDKKIFTTVFQAAALQTTQDIIKNEQELVQWFKAQGKTVIEVDREPFMEAVDAYMSNATDLPWTQEQIQELKAIGR